MRRIIATQREGEKKASKCVYYNLGLYWHHPREQVIWKARLDSESVV